MIRKLYSSVAGLQAAGGASADWDLNMPSGVTEPGAASYDLHMQVF